MSRAVKIASIVDEIVSIDKFAMIWDCRAILLKTGIDHKKFYRSEKSAIPILFRPF